MPESVTELPWLDSTRRRLEEAAVGGRLGHALLITGVAGLGQSFLAEALAARLLCASPEDGLACGVCRACQLLGSNSHPDLHRLAPPEDKKTIGVDQVRALIADLHLASHHGGARVGLVDPAHAMGHAAANSLLKTLEEPPSGTFLILVTDRPASLPATVRSRCQLVAVPTPSHEDALRWLAGQGGDADWASLLAHAEGAPLAALAMAEAGFDRQSVELADDLLALLKGQETVTAISERWAKLERRRVFSWLERSVSALIRSASTGEMAAELPESLQKVVPRIDLVRCFSYLDSVRGALRDADTPLNPQAAMESLLVPWTRGAVLAPRPKEG